MKQLSITGQKTLKFVHITFASLWLSSVIILAVLPFLFSKITDGGELYMYTLVYFVIDMFVLTPAASITLITGFIYSVFTKWGFVKHGWLIYKWIITLAIIIAGTFYLGPMVENFLEIADIKRIGALQDAYYMKANSIGLWAAIINTLLLVGAVAVSIYKPWKNIRR